MKTTKTQQTQTFNRLACRHLKQITQRRAGLEAEWAVVQKQHEKALALTNKLKGFKLEFRHAGAETVCLVTFKGGSSFGVARRSPSDLDRPEVGESVALSRAIANLLG